MAERNSAPLYDKVADRNIIIHRSLSVTILIILFSLLIYRIFLINEHGIPWFLALLSESWFSFYWLTHISTKWKPVDYTTYPEHFMQQESNRPGVDMFVTTADPVLERPIITINTVLSLLAIDYPTNKLACYVSDDGCSPILLYSLLEASKFAKLWVPFCKRYRIQVRAPFRFFSTKFVPAVYDASSSDYYLEWKKLKHEYELLSQKIQGDAQNSVAVDLAGDFAPFVKAKRIDHSSIVKVVWENTEGDENGVPHLIYVSREKNPKHPHHYKAGAMNVLTRVSAVMTNAPFMLNLDCDMYVNNPRVALHAMCLLLGSKNERESGFVQTPQRFYDGLKDDPYGNQYIVMQKFLARGQNGLQGPIYGGTGCFHRRKVIYGFSPNDSQMKAKLTGIILEKQIGKSMKLKDSAARALSGAYDVKDAISSCVHAAIDVARCSYECGTGWGKEIGWVYGSVTEDILTGLKIHSRGWRSVYLDLNPDAFLGCASTGGPISMTQQKRWVTGFMEILLCKHNPLLGTLTGELQFRACVGYLMILVWPIRSIPELCYAVLPSYSIISNKNFLPKVDDPAILIPIALFITYELLSLWEFYQAGQSIKACWNNQKMSMIISTSTWLFGLIDAVLKSLGISETIFEITQKDADADESVNTGAFTFDASPLFIPGTTNVLVHLIALPVALFRLLWKRPYDGSLLGEMICSILVLLHFTPFLRGFIAKGKYGIPACTIYKSAALAVLFCGLAYRVK